MKKELLLSITKKDFVIDFFSGKGAGGQYRNKHQNCVRLHHKDSNTIVTGQSYRNRRSNLKEALHNLVNNPRFKLWHTRKINEMVFEKTIEEAVNEAMKPENLLIEGREDGVWKSL